MLTLCDLDFIFFSIPQIDKKVKRKSPISIENAVVGTYQKIEDAFVDKFLEEDEESIEENNNKQN